MENLVLSSSVKFLMILFEIIMDDSKIFTGKLLTSKMTRKNTIFPVRIYKLLLRRSKERHILAQKVPFTSKNRD